MLLESQSTTEPSASVGKDDVKCCEKDTQSSLEEKDNPRTVSKFNNPSGSDDNGQDDGENKDGESLSDDLSGKKEKEEEDKDGLVFTYYPIVSGMKGTLIEINEKLINNPELIVNEVIPLLTLLFSLSFSLIVFAQSSQ